jgi:hypothetical protein
VRIPEGKLCDTDLSLRIHGVKYVARAFADYLPPVLPKPGAETRRQWPGQVPNQAGPFPKEGPGETMEREANPL